MEVFYFEPQTVDEFDWWWEQEKFGSIDHIVWHRHVLLAVAVGVIYNNELQRWQYLIRLIAILKAQRKPVPIKRYREFFRIVMFWRGHIYGPDGLTSKEIIDDAGRAREFTLRLNPETLSPGDRWRREIRLLITERAPLRRFQILQERREARLRALERLELVNSDTEHGSNGEEMDLSE